VTCGRHQLTKRFAKVTCHYFWYIDYLVGIRDNGV
jgi:hypothetical protein